MKTYMHQLCEIIKNKYFECKNSRTYIMRTAIISELGKEKAKTEEEASVEYGVY